VHVAHFWESPVVPQVAFVGEAVSNESKLALLDILLDRVPEVVSIEAQGGWFSGRTRILPWKSSSTLDDIVCSGLALCTNLKLGIGPSRDLNDHVQDSLLLICIQGNVMER
jgi:hypothetical protein